MLVCYFFFNDTATTDIYTLSLHDALPIFLAAADTLARTVVAPRELPVGIVTALLGVPLFAFLLRRRSEEHTSELQSHSDLVCRLLLEKKNRNGLDNVAGPRDTTTSAEHQL